MVWYITQLVCAFMYPVYDNLFLIDRLNINLEYLHSKNDVIFEWNELISTDMLIKNEKRAKFYILTVLSNLGNHSLNEDYTAVLLLGFCIIVITIIIKYLISHQFCLFSIDNLISPILHLIAETLKLKNAQR